MTNELSGGSTCLVTNVSNGTSTPAASTLQTVICAGVPALIYKRCTGSGVCNTSQPGIVHALMLSPPLLAWIYASSNAKVPLTDAEIQRLIECEDFNVDLIGVRGLQIFYVRYKLQYAA